MRGLRIGAAVAVVTVASLALSACGSKSNGGGGGSSSPSVAAPVSSGTSSASTGTSTTATSSAATAAAVKACMVLDTGGIDDKSFNESSYAGMIAANKADPKISISYVPSNSGNDYTPNLTAEVQKNCQTIIAVGGLMADNVKAIAAKDPTKHFAEVDAASSGPNDYGIQFDTAQGGFLGGYLAAAYSKTGKVATWGGLNIPPVTIYMDGFWEGVQYYNAQEKKSVQVLGWNEKNQKGGTFVPGNNPFGDVNGGKAISQAFINQGADVIFPVAGGSGLGAAAAAQTTGGKVSVLWVDTDGCVSVAQYCKYFLSSVTKGLASSVQSYLGKVAAGTYPTGSYVGTLANGGTGLAPFHDYASKVSSAIKSQLAQVTKDIESGKIKITSPSQPKA